MGELKNYLIIVAGGNGTRMGSKIKKQYLQIDDVPILTLTLKAFENIPVSRPYILVIPKEDHEFCRKTVLYPFGLDKKVALVGGGQNRQESVYNGLKYLKETAIVQKEELVLIHDGVRPFVATDTILSCIKSAAGSGACIPVAKVTDTVKKIKDDRLIEKTLPRETLGCAQTPQVFQFSLIWNAFQEAQISGFTGTDDASLVERTGAGIHVVEGSALNIKITTPEDLVLGKFILSRKGVKS